jgi:sodium-dependent dicarboxylate transporter 2/3/5
MNNSDKEQPKSEAEDTKCRSCKRVEWLTFTMPRKLNSFIYSKRNLLVAIVIAVVSYFLISGQPEMVRRVVATFTFAAGCWVLEVFPLPITGLMIPVVLSLLGVFSPQQAFAPFSNSIIFLMIGGLVLGQAIKKHGLDRWIGYNLITFSKGKIDRLILLTMLATAFISMWMSNTVAIAVILPVALSILTAIPEQLVNLRKKMLLGISISTSIGGMAMLTGSTPAMIAAGLLEQTNNFGFLQWAYYGLPVSMASLAIAFLVLKKMFHSPKLTLNLDEVLAQKKQAERFSSSQKKVIAVFLGTVIFWFMGGQIEQTLGMSASISSAALVSIMAVLVMFGSNLLDLRDLQSIQWELIFLVGGGLLLGEAIIASGAAGQISGALFSFNSVAPMIVLPLLFGVISLILTNFISNSATGAMLIPIAIETSRLLGITPVPFVMAVALSAIIAFITPVGVPSTALVYSTGRVSKGELIKAGVTIAIPTLMVSLLAVWLLPPP